MNVKKLVGSFAALSLVTSVFAAETSAPATTQDAQPAEMSEEEECPLSIELSVDIMSDYVFRGFIYNDNPVWQPSVTLSYETEDWGGVYANVWSSFDLTRKRGYASAGRRACGLQEIDYTLAYYINLFGFDFEAGHMWYTYPNGNNYSERELFASVAYENPFVTPTFAAYWLYGGCGGDDRSSVYYNFSLEHEFEIGDSLTLTPNANLGFGGNAWCRYMTGESTGTELTDQTIGLKAAYAITEYLSVGAQINYTWLPSKTLRHNGYMGGNGDKNQLCWGGVNMTLSF